jgi:hypothetical protein
MKAFAGDGMAFAKAITQLMGRLWTTLDRGSGWVEEELELKQVPACEDIEDQSL